MKSSAKHHPTIQHKQHVFLGVIFAILAATTFTLMGMIIKFIGNAAPINTIIFARFTISLVLILPWIAKNPKQIIHVPQPIKIIIRSAVTLIAFSSFFYALEFIPLSNALLLNSTSPLFVPLITWCLFKVKTPPKVWGGIILGFIGIVLVLNPNPKIFQLPSLIGLCSGVATAIAVVTVRSLTKHISILQILFYNFFICSILSGISLPFTWKPIGSTTLFLLLWLGILGTLYQFFSALSLAKAPVRLTAPLLFLSIVLGVAADFIVWNQIPDTLALIGISLVIIGGIITIYFGQKAFTSNIKK